MPDFSQRSTAEEMMDDFNLGHEIIDPIMNELEIINKFLGGHQLFFNAFNTLELKDGMTISDWGCGGGDSLRAIADWSRKKNLKLHLIGIDATESALTYARKHSAKYPEIKYIHSDIMSPELRPGQFDLVISSLFTHHFEDDSWIKLIKKMTSCATYRVIVNDLHRHWLAYHSIGVLTKLFSGSEMVRNDSKLSVLRSFKRKEIKKLLRSAEIQNYELRWKWAFRWQLIISCEKNSVIDYV